MRKDLLSKIIHSAEQDAAPIQQYALRNYGLDFQNRNQLEHYIELHPEAVLPDMYMEMGNSKNLYISWHSPFFNQLPHAHNFFEINYVVQGCVIDFIDGIEVPLNKGEFCINNPNAIHEIRDCSEEDFLLNILISKELFQQEVFTRIAKDQELDRFFFRYLSSTGDSPNHMAFTEVPNDIEPLFEQLIEEYFRNDCSDVLLMATFLLIFGKLLRNHKADPFTEELVDYVSNHIKDATLSTAASHFQYHEKYFAKLVRTHTGNTFHQLLTDARMRRAAAFLRDTSWPVERIAEEVGYAEPSTFYGNFRTAYGTSPRKYRVQITE